MTREKRNTRTSLKDIADRVGVTKMTVSRFMRNPELVSAQTRDKISKAVDELGYIHNRAPAMLSKASSKAIGVLLPSLSNQVFANFTQGIESVTNKRGYEVLLAHYGYNQETEERKVATLLSYHVDGIILTSTKHSENTLKMLKTANVPVVESMELTDHPIDMVVGLDHQEAAYSAVQSMLAKGRTKIAYFGARLDNRTKYRMEGYDRAIVDAGAQKYHFLTPNHSSFTLGRELLARALVECPNLDGIFCTNDDIAIGTILACQEKGIRIPEDISIIGYNALDIGQAISPKLTSVYTPRYEMGETSADILLDRIEGLPNKKKIYDLSFTITKGESS
ncbi:substrate-binding domain-containing protein [Neiella marina]|uniref:Substrate-binding domain-containing protein n=1 Tax=Neiella holothuriorum TaxID=2870530 RepID=A0ABS7EHZ8_9GAMM|nr:substrate-binding domain-containing protein [Neiella holothuriorum]MBW8191910.1 substrate-binding domain-containing protein [Neiella holothuriorum]